MRDKGGDTRGDLLPEAGYVTAVMTPQLHTLDLQFLVVDCVHLHARRKGM